MTKKPSYLEGSSPVESKDPPEDNGGCASGFLFFKPPRKVQLKEVHNSNETAFVRVMTPDEEKSVAKGPHKRRPAPPPPPKQPPRRPPPPPPPVTPPPSEVAVYADEKLEIDDSSTVVMNEPHRDIQPRMLDSASLIYPKNSYMSYKSEKSIGRQGFQGKYRRSFYSSTSSMDLATCDSSSQDGKNVYSPSSWEQIDNLQRHDTTGHLEAGNRFHRSNSQDCVLVEGDINNRSDHILSIFSGHISENQSSNSICCPEIQDRQQQSVPCQSTSHERVQNSSSNSHQILYYSKEMSLKSTIPDVSLDCETSDSSSALDSRRKEILDEKLIHNIDHNQNSVKNTKSFKGDDIKNQINIVTRKYCKTKAELECEQLALDFIHHYGDVNLKNLLVPAPNHKTMSDYIEGLLNLEMDKNGLECQTLLQNQNDHRIDKWSIASEKLVGKFCDCNEIFDNQNLDNDFELKRKKEALIISIGKKIESLKDEQKNIRAEIIQNESLGKEITNQLQALAKPNEMEKYLLHVEEMEKIVNLLLSLSSRLARAENILENMQCSNSEEKILIETKRDKLKEQHEDACTLKESIDKRSNQVSTFLQKYLSDSEFANYDRFIKRRTKLIVDVRKIDEKISLGEEQLAAISVVAHIWKNASS